MYIAVWGEQSKTIVFKAYLGYLENTMLQKVKLALTVLETLIQIKRFLDSLWTFFFFSSLKLLKAIDLRRNSHTYVYHSTNKLLSLSRTEVGKSVFCGTKFLSHGVFKDCYVRDTLKTWDIMHVTGLTMKSHQQKLQQLTAL